ncbi:MAG: type II secretion system protein [Chloroflexi bacterium]|nr:MAG: type II secretion system protein [Chloroflexota bacterium]
MMFKKQGGFTIVELLIVIVKDVTGSACTNCGNQAAYEQALDRIGLAAGMNLNGLKVGNPWGAKYVLDENELENMTSNNGCNRDGIGVGLNVPSGVTGFNVPVIPTYSC